MRKVVVLFVLSFFVSTLCLAIDYSDNFLSLLNLSAKNTTKDKVTNLLGRPVKVEENKKKTWWHYNSHNTNLVICWNKKSNMLERYSFKSLSDKKAPFDYNVYHK